MPKSRWRVLVGGLIRSDTHFPRSSPLLSSVMHRLVLREWFSFVIFVCRGFGRVYIFIDSLLDILVSTLLFSLFLFSTLFMILKNKHSLYHCLSLSPLLSPFLEMFCPLLHCPVFLYHFFIIYLVLCVRVLPLLFLV